MSFLFAYIIKLSISLAVVFLFYWFLLRRLTFHQWNRWYLLLYSALSFAFASIDISLLLKQHEEGYGAVQTYIPSLAENQVIQYAVSHDWTWKEAVVVFIGIGVTFMFMRLLVQQISIYRLRKKSTLISGEGVRLYQVEAPIMPFSYGNSIFVNQHQHGEEELKEIIKHEFIHVKQRHTIDMLVAEWICILNWYNPFAWMIKSAIRQNLEYIADQYVLNQGIDKKTYQYLLLKVIGVSQFSIATKFNFASLKKRIAMMNKMRSAKMHLVKFLFIVPLAGVLLVAFRSAQASEAQQPTLTLNNTDTVPKPAGTTAKPKAKGWKHIKVMNDKAVVEKEDGTKEEYDLSDPQQEKDFQDKYGKIPTPPPPPPPPPPPGSRSGVTAPVPPVPPTPPGVAAPAPPPPPPPTAKPNSKGYIISIADNDGECVVIIKDKNRKILQSMLLTDWDKNKAANVAKYGELPPPSPPIPAIAPVPPVDATIIIAPTPAQYEKAALNPVEHKISVTGTSTMVPNPAFRIKGTDDPIIYVDGKMMPDDFDVNSISPNDISSINVLKDASAEKFNGGSGKGVIQIYTKNGSAGTFVTVGDSKPTNENPPIVKKETVEIYSNGYEDRKTKFYVESKYNGYFIVNGKEMTKDEFYAMKLQPDSIKSMRVWKGETAVKKFGDKAKEGVIEVEVK